MSTTKDRDPAAERRAAVDAGFTPQPPMEQLLRWRDSGDPRWQTTSPADRRAVELYADRRQMTADLLDALKVTETTGDYR